jgi:hypothetical protein
VPDVGYKAIKKKVCDILEAEAVEDGTLEGVTVHYGPFRANPEACPYVAVYGGGITRGKTRIGGAKPRDATISVKIDSVAYSLEDFADSDDKLMDLLDAVESVLDDDDTLEALQALGVIYSEIGQEVTLDEEQVEGFFSGASLTLKLEVRR